MAISVPIADADLLPIDSCPLLWRWISPRHAMFPPGTLRSIRPLVAAKAAEVGALLAQYLGRDGLLRGALGADRYSAEGEVAAGTAWLSGKHALSDDPVLVSWDDAICARLPWRVFAEKWDDFCYPLSDDVMVLGVGGRWVLHYHHEEVMEFAAVD